MERNKQQGHVSTEERPCGNIARRRPSARLQEKTIPADLLALDFPPPELSERELSLRHPVYSVLLGKP